MILVKNKFNFTNLNSFKAEWELLRDGKRIKTGHFRVLDVPPGEQSLIPVPEEIASLIRDQDGEFLLNIAVKLAEKKIRVHSGKMVLEFDKETGGITSLKMDGIEMILKPGFDQMSWYGRGPHENYIDRNSSAHLGIFRGKVSDQFVNYPVPQENGNKTDVRWVKIRDREDRGIRITSARPFETSAHHFSLNNLSEAAHTYELVRQDQVFWYIDFQQNGLGGNSCGPRPLSKYLLKPEAIEFSFTITPSKI